MHGFIHFFNRASIHPFIHSFVNLLHNHYLISFSIHHLLIYLIIHSFTHSIIHSLVCSFLQSCIHIFIHSYIYHYKRQEEEKDWWTLVSRSSYEYNPRWRTRRTTMMMNGADFCSHYVSYSDVIYTTYAQKMTCIIGRFCCRSLYVVVAELIVFSCMLLCLSDVLLWTISHVFLFVTERSIISCSHALSLKERDYISHSP